MKYETAKRLKDAGFPQTAYYDLACPHKFSDPAASQLHECDEIVVFPTSDELIRELGDVQFVLIRTMEGFLAITFTKSGKGSEPDEALAELYIATRH